MQETPIDPLADDLAELRELIKELPPACRPSPATRWRWINKGARGTRLRTIKICGRVCTTRREFRRFIAAIQQPHQEVEPADTGKVNDELARRGFLKTSQ